MSSLSGAGMSVHLCWVLQSLVDIVKHGLEDENQKVKTITALTIAALAEAAAPYGIESFDDVLKPLWTQIRILRGKVGIYWSHSHVEGI